MNGTQSNSIFASATAVTEVTEDTFVFYWNIKGFKVCLKEKDPDESDLKSPLFRFDEGNITHQWYLTIQWSEKEEGAESNEEEEYLSIYLHLVDGNTPVKVSFRIEIFNSEKCWEMGEDTIKTFDEDTLDWGFPNFMKLDDILDPMNKVLEDDTLKVQCHIKLKRNAGRIISCSKDAKTCKRKYDLISDIGDLYNSSTFTDVSIQTRNSVFKANKSILSCRSPIFAVMFQAKMSEAINNVVEITDFDDDVVDGMLKFIYSGEIIQELLEKKAMDLYQIADKYDIKGLKEDSEKVISRNLSVENVSESLIFADMNNAPNLKENAIKLFNMNTPEVKKTEGFKNLLKYDPSIFRDIFQAL